MSPFQLFAVGLVAGTLLQLTGLALIWLYRSGFLRWQHWPRVGVACWTVGVASLFFVAAHDRDVTLFVGQALVVYGFWKIGWLRV